LVAYDLAGRGFELSGLYRDDLGVGVETVEAPRYGVEHGLLKRVETAGRREDAEYAPEHEGCIRRSRQL
jgi:hypothetical protein